MNRKSDHARATGSLYGRGVKRGEGEGRGRGNASAGEEGGHGEGAA